MKTGTNTMLLLSAFLLLISCKNAGKTEGEQTIIVNVSDVTPIAGNGEKEYPFISKPFRTSELSFRVSGPLEHFEVYPGNYYPQGSLIAGIDPRDFRIRKERTEALYNQAKAEYERIRILFEKNNISASAYEKAKADCITARTAFETASNELNDTRLTAPFNGYIGEVHVENYQEVKASQPVLSFIETDRLKLEAFVTQEVALQIQSMDSVTVRFDALPDKYFRAKVAEVSKNTSHNNLSYILTALLSNTSKELLSGMSGKILLETTSGTETLVIPQTALCHRPSKGNYVWVVDEATGKVNCREINTGDLLPNGYIAVRGGLRTGEKLAVSGLRFLSDGMIVQISEKEVR